MKLPSWPFLIGTAGIGGIAVGAIGLSFLNSINSSLNKVSFVHHAISLTKEQPVVRERLGENIEVGKVNVGDGFAKVNETSIQVKVPMKGEVDNAFIYAYARKKNKQDSFRLFKLEAEFSKIRGKKLLILDRSNEDQSTDEEWLQAFVEAMRLASEKKKVKTPAELAEEERLRVKSMTAEERKEYYRNKMKEMKPKEE